MTRQAIRRVVITGLGVIAPNGSDLAEFWRSLCEGTSAVGWLTQFDPGSSPCRLAAEVKEFKPGRYMDARKSRRWDRALQFELAAARRALEDAGWANGQRTRRMGLVDGTVSVGWEALARAAADGVGKGVRSGGAPALMHAYLGASSGEVDLALGLRGPHVTVGSGCVSGNAAVGLAFRQIQADEADAMLAGGTDAALNEGAWASLTGARLMTRWQDKPSQAMRPFDRHRDGFVLGEGAAFVVLEELGHAVARRARIYAEVLGHGQSSEGVDAAPVLREGRGLAGAMERALAEARLHPGEIDYVNAHGSATEAGDLAETDALKEVFGRWTSRVAVSSTKPVTGHLLGAAGALETVVCALAIARGAIPPTLNHAMAGDGCDLDYVPKRCRPYPVRHALNLSSGFEGKDACLVLGRYREGA